MATHSNQKVIKGYSSSVKNVQCICVGLRNVEKVSSEHGYLSFSRRPDKIVMVDQPS